jgi:hypothetical protein
MGDGASFCMAVCGTALLVGLASTYPPEYQWIFDGIVAFSATGLIYASRAWRRAYIPREGER